MEEMGVGGGGGGRQAQQAAQRSDGEDHSEVKYVFYFKK